MQRRGSGTITLTGSGGNIATGGGNDTISSTITGTVGLTKKGTGTLTLTRNNTYSGDTRIAEGILRVGAVNALPVTTVVTLGQSGTSLNGKLVFGDGTTGFDQTVAGLAVSGSGTDHRIVGGGLNRATLTVNNASDYSFSGFLGGSGTYENNLALVKSGGGTSEFDLGRITPGNGDGHYSQLNVFGNLTFMPGATLSLMPWGGFMPSVGNEFTILSWSGSLSGFNRFVAGTYSFRRFATGGDAIGQKGTQFCGHLFAWTAEPPIDQTAKHLASARYGDKLAVRGAGL